MDVNVGSVRYQGSYICPSCASVCYVSETNCSIIMLAIYVFLRRMTWQVVHQQVCIRIRIEQDGMFVIVSMKL